MAEEIQFYGFKSGSNVTNQAIKNSLDKVGIYFPATLSLQIEDLKSVKPEAFTWPILVGVSGGQSNYVAKSYSDLNDFLDTIRNPNLDIFIRLLPQASAVISNGANSTFSYLGRDYICAHNVEHDIGITIPFDNSQLLENNMRESVYRLVCGSFGWFFDSLFDYNDSRLAPITSCRLSDLEVDFNNFQLGYKAGFSSQVHYEDCLLPKNLSLDSYVGDLYSFGCLVGAAIRTSILSKLSGNTGSVDKSSILMLKLFNGEEVFNSIVILAKLHNDILSNRVQGLAITTARVLNQIKSHSVSSGKSITYVCNALTEFLSKVCHTIGHIYECEILSTPDTDNLQVTTEFSAERKQFRVLSNQTNSVSLRMQLSNSEVISNLITGEERYSVMTWKNIGNSEIDILVEPSHLGFKDDSDEWLAWGCNLANIVCLENSTYVGSSAKYAPLIFNQGGFYAQGHLVIPKNIFFKKLSSFYNVKIFNQE